MTDNAPETPLKKRQHRRSTVSILKAAKAAGCASVEFSDGTVVKIKPDEVSTSSASNNEVEQWFADHAN